MVLTKPHTSQAYNKVPYTHKFGHGQTIQKRLLSVNSHVPLPNHVPAMTPWYSEQQQSFQWDPLSSCGPRKANMLVQPSKGCSGSLPHRSCFLTSTQISPCGTQCSKAMEGLGHGQQGSERLWKKRQVNLASILHLSLAQCMTLGLILNFSELLCQQV